MQSSLLFQRLVPQFITLLTLLLVLLVVGGCRTNSASNVVVRPGSPRVFFTEPRAGAVVSSPVTLKWAAEGIKIEPAADGIKPGSGHLHVIVNAPCAADGQIVPTDETHLHYGRAQTEAAVDLKPGAYKLCLQMADAAHAALAGAGMRHEITVIVR